MTGTVILDPLVPMLVLWMAVALGTLGVALAVWRRLPGWWLRGLAGLALLAALANPSLQREDREPLSDIVVLVVDESASQRIADRPDQTTTAIANVQAEIARRENTELRIVTVGDSAIEGDSGTLLMTGLSEALAEEPQGRVAGIILLTDGRLHDLPRAPALPAPLHALLTGQPEDWDRRLVVSNAPAFAILGEPVTLTLRVEDQGAAPATDFTQLTIAIDGAPPLPFEVPVGQDVELPITLPHGGMNVLQFEIPTATGELTDRNNSAVIQINGVRDRLRVLLVSGEPHPGERTWRNLLKSDSSVDLVHFTILRPPAKQDGVPVNELSLIAFPTRELFLEKIDEFDLIIFDRYSRRGILPNEYLDNIRDYVENGGAVLVSSGPEYGSAESIYRSPLGAVLPGAPTARVFEEGYKPQITDIGERHPVTEGLAAFSPAAEADDGPGWGRWFRLVDVIAPPNATTVMSGLDDRPLLTLERIGEGRVSLIASDQSWLWDRGYEGGGPQLELLRRLAHWMMKEPELEEEALWAEPTGQTMRIIRRTLETEIGDITVTHPDGSTTVLTLEEVSPGRFETLWDAPEMGLYRLSDGNMESVIALGPAAPREFEETIATGDLLDPIVGGTRGGILNISAGSIDIREVRAGRPAAGRGWIGITPRDAYQTADITITPLLPAWAFLLLASFLVIGAWMREGRG